MSISSFLDRLSRVPLLILSEICTFTFKIVYILVFLKPHEDEKVIVNKRYFGPSRQETRLTEKLDEWGIDHVPQYRDKRWGRRFSIDVYLPDYNVGLEVNGTFKYKDGVISPYYTKRANLIYETSGIIIVDIVHTRVNGMSKKDLIKMIKSAKAKK